MVLSCSYSHLDTLCSTPLPRVDFHLPLLLRALPENSWEPQGQREGSAPPSTHLLSKVFLQGLIGCVGFVSSPFFFSQNHKLCDTQILRLGLTQVETCPHPTLPKS